MKKVSSPRVVSEIVQILINKMSLIFLSKLICLNKILMSTIFKWAWSLVICTHSFCYSLKTDELCFEYYLYMY